MESSAQSTGRNRHGRHHHLGPVLAEFIAAVNAFDGDAIVATFAGDALVNDVHREFWGAEAIRRWVAREIVGDRVTIAVTEVFDRHGDAIVRGRYDGDYDKTNLPDPLIPTHYFTVRDGKIVTLIVIPNTPPATEAPLARPAAFTLDAPEPAPALPGLGSR